MAATTSLCFKIKTVVLVLLSPRSLSGEEERYNGQPRAPSPPPISQVRQGLWEALRWSMGVSALGAALPLLFVFVFGLRTAALAAWIAITGAAVLLYATLAFQGWKLQTIGGVTLAEDVNRWIFRGLYLAGTFLIVLGSAWATLSTT